METLSCVSLGPQEGTLSLDTMLVSQALFCFGHKWKQRCISLHSPEKQNQCGVCMDGEEVTLGIGLWDYGGWQVPNLQDGPAS